MGPVSPSMDSRKASREKEKLKEVEFPHSTKEMSNYVR